jgi:alpha-D-ribose 1-methylphosphonate 5-triphosphate synthase subunit PhnH
MSAATAALLDTIRADQQTFRVTLNALANPGQIERIAVTPRPDAPALNGNRATTQLLMALLDHEVSFSVEPGPDSGAFAAYILKRTRCPIVSADRAAFVVADHSRLDPQLPLELRTGNFDYPDDAATLIVQVPSLDQAQAGETTLSLEGPGVPGRRLLKLSGIDAAFFAAREQANRHYPIGIDLILIDQEGRIAGLPRTTQVSIVTGANA